METTFIIPRPPSVNGAYGHRQKGQPGRGRYVSPKLSKWRQAASKEIQAMGPMKRFASAVTVEIWASEDTSMNKIMDGDNLVKPVLDLLVSLGVIIDDCRKIVRKSSIEWREGDLGMITIFIRETSLPASRTRETKNPTSHDKAWAVRQIKKKIGISIHPDRIHL